MTLPAWGTVQAVLPVLLPLSCIFQAGAACLQSICAFGCLTELRSACRVHFQTEGGVYGFTLLEDSEFYAKDTRPNENIPDLSQNPNDPFDNSRRRQLLMQTAEDRGRDAGKWELPGPGIPLQ